MRSDLYRLAREFRGGIERYCRTLPSALAMLQEGLGLHNGFPNQCCYDSSLLLARFLKEHRIAGIRLTITNSHTWLLVSGWIIDVTGDQEMLKELNLQPVEVTRWNDSRYKDLQKMFEVWTADYRQLYASEPDIIEILDQAYSDILTYTRRTKKIPIPL
ncbi:hypothetical protein J2T17_006397 [Paenibacillus mucilaginosus]|uniref:hypothetical protein n=1 Tax=Paenibacillus mucilaginosus TaxID=61624 RepID=UPI003D204934